MFIYNNSCINKNVKAKTNKICTIFTILTFSILSIFTINIVYGDTVIDTVSFSVGYETNLTYLLVP
jgi:hypothetical protein